MAITYNLAPMPKWYIADLTGKPLGGGSMYTYRSLDKTDFKYVFQDIGGNLPWTDPILFDENGSQGPFYWEVDSGNPDETYYIEVYDAAGVLQWTIDDFFPSGSGGGGNTTTALNLTNLVINNVFWRNSPTSNPISSTLTRIAPGAHSGLADTASHWGPDIYFFKNNLNATDQVTFPKFTLGSTPLTGDVTPVEYLNYTCTNSPGGETSKYIQIPITQGVQNLSNQNVTVTIWTRSNLGSASIILFFIQFYGDGAGATPVETTAITTITAGASWHKTVVTTTIPSVAGKTLGACGNDALFLDIEYPLGIPCDIDITKPCVYIGNVAPDAEYVTYDVIDSTINSPRTGHVVQGFEASALPGYIPMDDGSIGSSSSGATNRASTDTFPLYALIWNNVNNAFAPVSTGRGASAVDDFTANKTLTLSKALGRVLGGAGSGAGLTPRPLGSFLGEETHILTEPEMPIHNHGYDHVVGAVGPIQGGGGFDTAPTFTLPSGGNQPHNIMQPSVFINLYIKL